MRKKRQDQGVVSRWSSLGGFALGDHVKIDRPGFYGHGEIGAVQEIHGGIYVRIPNRQCFRFEDQHLTKVEQTDCKLGCCKGRYYPWEQDADRKVLQETIQDL